MKAKVKYILGDILLTVMPFVVCADIDPAPNDIGVSYICLYADFALVIFNAVMLAVIVAVAIGVIKTKRIDFKSRCCSTSAIIVMACVIAITLAGSLLISSHYDAVKVDEGGEYRFLSYKAFSEPKEYTVDDVREVEVFEVLGIRLRMNDGSKVNLICGSERETAEFSEKYEEGEYEAKLIAELDEKGIPITVNNREKIQKKIDKYFNDSDQPYYSVYLPQILALAD